MKIKILTILIIVFIVLCFVDVTYYFVPTIMLAVIQGLLLLKKFKKISRVKSMACAVLLLFGIVCQIYLLVYQLNRDQDIVGTQIIWTIINFVIIIIGLIMFFKEKKENSKEKEEQDKDVNANFYENKVGVEKEILKQEKQYENEKPIKHINTEGRFGFGVNVCKKTNNKKGSEYYKKSLMTESESLIYKKLYNILKNEYALQTQIPLSSIVKKGGKYKYANELYRTIDFGIFNHNKEILLAIELNDYTHYKKDRKERDDKVKSILQKVNIPLLVLWDRSISEEKLKKKLSTYITIK